jgi:hypothetical protein
MQFRTRRKGEVIHDVNRLTEKTLNCSSIPRNHFLDEDSRELNG